MAVSTSSKVQIILAYHVASQRKRCFLLVDMVHLANETELQTHLDDLVPLIDAPQLKEPLKVLDDIPEPLMLAWFPCPLDRWGAAQFSITDDAMRRGLSVLRYLHSRDGLNLIMKGLGQGTSGKSVFFALLRKLLGPALGLLL